MNLKKGIENDLYSKTIECNEYIANSSKFDKLNSKSLFDHRFYKIGNLVNIGSSEDISLYDASCKSDLNVSEFSYSFLKIKPKDKYKQI